MSRLIWLLIAAMIGGIALGVGLQDVGAQTATGTVSIQKYYCTYLDETLLVEAIDVNECAPGGATFTFYLVGDGTADYQQLVLGATGLGSIELPVGSYEMVEEGTQTFFNITVGTAEPVQLLIANPAVDVDPTAVPAQPQPTAVPSAPIALPNTGAGVDSEGGILALALTVAAGLATGGALTVRRHRHR